MKVWRAGVWAGLLGLALSVLAADPAAGAGDALQRWLVRLHEASRHRAYTGTFVVTANGVMASARIWHACEGEQQVERVESLSGVPRATFRRNTEVVTFFPASRVVVTETREALGHFPGLLTGNTADLGKHYQLRPLGQGRSAGFEAEVAQVEALDTWRYGYRIWSEKRTGLVLQMQILGPEGQVLEQSAFSELQLDAKVNAARLQQMMQATVGYRVERPQLDKVDAQTVGWRLRDSVPGFAVLGCYRRPTENPSDSASLQWVVSDGLATVSLFAERFDAQRHLRAGLSALGGATRSLTRRHEDWWLTAVGEVPPATLQALVTGLELRR